jgi:ATP-dependent DNA ligase
MTANIPDEQPRDPKQWRPLEARLASRAPEIKDPIIEPAWQGLRVLAHYRSAGVAGAGDVVLIDIDGNDVTRQFTQVVEALARAVYAQNAVIDGVITDQATAAGEGVGIVPEAGISPVGMLLGRPAEVGVEAVQGRTPGDDVAFVALDLLAVDGEPLFDLPLLERKRQLDGLIAGNEFARVSPFARPPLAQWLNSWKSAGFRGVVLKAANSRYRAADVAKSWAIVERAGPR